ncbi:RNA 2',3'-cyclic phosphodiesterase [bacterium HR21]|jgi:2'-5' RNA ligase|nr:RNA 2',3'-cyclic phosphodiesterase [bacterium HR21]
MRPRKTHTTALVLIPPEELWEPIQALRRQYDRKVRRWMPHITLLYPFRPRDLFPEVLPLLRAACARLRPFSLQLREFRLFHHGPRSHTIWLAPEPAEPICELHRRLLELFPDCHDQSRYPSGFTPHLSIGQYRGPRQAAERFCASLRRQWQPLRFAVSGVVLIARNDPPDDIFEPVAYIPFGSREAAPEELCERFDNGDVL